MFFRAICTLLYLHTYGSYTNKFSDLLQGNFYFFLENTQKIPTCPRNPAYCADIAVLLFCQNRNNYLILTSNRTFTFLELASADYKSRMALANFVLSIIAFVVPLMALRV